MEKPFLTIQQVAEFLSMTDETVRIKIRKKMLKGYKVGKKWLIEYDDMMKFVHESYKLNLPKKGTEKDDK